MAPASSGARLAPKWSPKQGSFRCSAAASIRKRVWQGGCGRPVARAARAPARPPAGSHRQVGHLLGPHGRHLPRGGHGCLREIAVAVSAQPAAGLGTPAIQPPPGATSAAGSRAKKPRLAFIRSPPLRPRWRDCRAAAPVSLEDPSVLRKCSTKRRRPKLLRQGQR
jgi:hypothetical protein